jgi:two-component system phosphate regulon sensor histidine kinase PhoR
MLHLIIIIALSSLILILSLNTIREFYRDTLTDHLKTLGYSLNSEVAHLLDVSRANQLDEFIKSLGTKIHTRVTIIARDGKVLADSEENIQLMENHSHRPEVVEALRVKQVSRFDSAARLSREHGRSSESGRRPARPDLPG